MRIARCDYDKPHRCPGWSGTGWTYNKRDFCDGGSPRWAKEEDAYRGSSLMWEFKVRKTVCCGTYVLPHFLVWFEPHTYAWKARVLSWRIRDWWYWR